MNRASALKSTVKNRESKIVRAGAIGNFIEFFDFTLYGFFAVTIAQLFFPKYDQVAGLLSTFALFSVGFLVRPIGAIFFGYIGDRFGRKWSLFYSIGLMSVSTAMIGLLPTFAIAGVYAPLLLLCCRLVQGFSTGGEQTGAMVFVVEHADAGERGRRAAQLVRSNVVGVCSAAVLVLVINVSVSPDAMSVWGWRIPFLLAIPLGLIGLYMRAGVEDANSFRQNLLRGGSVQFRFLPVAEAIQTVPMQMIALFAWVAMLSLAGYVLVGFFVSRLVAFEHYPIRHALAVLIAVHIATALIVPKIGACFDCTGRLQFTLGLSFATAIGAVFTFFSLGHGAIVATVGMSVFAMLHYSAMIVCAVFVVEHFPIRTRYSATALPFQFAYTSFGGTAPYVATWLTAHVSYMAPAYYVAAVSILAVIPVAFVRMHREYICD